MLSVVTFASQADPSANDVFLSWTLRDGRLVVL